MGFFKTAHEVITSPVEDTRRRLRELDDLVEEVVTAPSRLFSRNDRKGR